MYIHIHIHIHISISLSLYIYIYIYIYICAVSLAPLAFTAQAVRGLVELILLALTPL